MIKKNLLITTIFVFLAVIFSVGCNKNNSNQTDSSENRIQSTPTPASTAKVSEPTLSQQVNSSKNSEAISEWSNSVPSEKVTTKKLSNIEWVYFGNSVLLEEKLGINVSQKFLEQWSKIDKKGFHEEKDVDKVVVCPFESIAFTSEKKDDVIVLLGFSDKINLEEKLIVEQLKKGANGLMIFSKENQKYEPKMIKLIPDNKKGISYKLKDIDSDKKDEILLSYGGGGNKQSFHILKIFKYIEGNTKELFSETMEYTNYYHYSSRNSYRFEPNKKNSNLLDILFEINVLGPDEELYKQIEPEKYNKEKKAELIKSVKDVITFSFDGKKYVPNKQLPKEYINLNE